MTARETLSPFGVSRAWASIDADRSRPIAASPVVTRASSTNVLGAPVIVASIAAVPATGTGGVVHLLAVARSVVPAKRRFSVGRSSARSIDPFIVNVPSLVVSPTSASATPEPSNTICPWSGSMPTRRSRTRTATPPVMAKGPAAPAPGW